jgi:hypothetical protein
VPSKAMRYDFFMLRSQNADQTNVTPNFRIIFPSSVERAGWPGVTPAAILTDPMAGAP